MSDADHHSDVIMGLFLSSTVFYRSVFLDHDMVGCRGCGPAAPSGPGQGAVRCHPVRSHSWGGPEANLPPGSAEQHCAHCSRCQQGRCPSSASQPATPAPCSCPGSHTSLAYTTHLGLSLTPTCCQHYSDYIYLLLFGAPFYC